MRILLLGGSKSGKSMLGQRLTRQLADGGSMIYWATLEPRDTEDRAIVRRHLAERDGWGFGTLERGRELLRRTGLGESGVRIYADHRELLDQKGRYYQLYTGQFQLS